MTSEDALNKFNHTHGNEYDYSKVEYVNQYKKVKIGHKHSNGIYWFEQRPKDHWNGQGCPECFGTPRKTTKEFIVEVKNKFGNQFDLSKIDYKTSTTPVIFGCRKHIGDNKSDSNGVFWFSKTPNAFLSDIYGCPRCSPNRRLDTEDFIFLSNKIHNSFYNYDKTFYKNSRTKVTITCPKHNDFNQLPTKHLIGEGCPACKQSLGEQAILKFLIDKNIENERYKKYNDLFDVNQLSYDFYIPSANLLIEFNGEQHYYPIDYYGGEEAFKLQKKHDKMKKQYAKNNNIDLLIISYLEFKNINTILEEKWQKVQVQL